MPTATPTPWPVLPHPPAPDPGHPIPFADLEKGHWLEADRPVSANRIKALGWVADGVVGYSERQASEALIAAALWHPAVFDTLMEMQWVQGDITVHEAYTIYRTRWIAKYAPDLAGAVLEKPWTQDGITRDEAEAIYQLYELIPAEDNPWHQTVIRKTVEILAMPFLDTVESHDALAIWSMRKFRRQDTAGFLELMDTPVLSDGISDDATKIVLLLGSTNKYKPESIPVLLDGTSVFMEERTIYLPYSGQTTLSIVRIREQAIPSASMERFEHAIRIIDDFMGVSFPTNHLVWFFDDHRTSGHHTGAHITSNPKRDDIGYGRGPRHAAHESGHYYWSSHLKHTGSATTGSSPGWQRVLRTSS